MKILNLAHICLLVKDLNASLHFYMDILGLEKGFDFTRKNGKRFGAYLKIHDRNFIEIFENASDRAKESSLTHLCLEVDDLETVVARLRENGIEVSDRKLGADNTFQAWTKDPDGNNLEFHQYTAESYQFSGVDCVL